TQQAQPFGQPIVIGDDHATFPGRDQLVAIKAKGRGGSKAADWLARAGRAERFRTVLDDPQPVASSEFDEWIHVARMSVEVDRQDRLGAWREQAHDAFNRQAPGSAFTVREDW